MSEKDFLERRDVKESQATSAIHLFPCEPSSNGYLIHSTNGLSKPFKLVIMERIDCETAMGGGSR